MMRRVRTGLLASLLLTSVWGCPATAPTTGGTGTATTPPTATASPASVASPSPAVQTPAANDGDRRFIDDMVPHHQTALMRADDALAKADHEELRAFARKMKEDQGKEIQELRSYRQQWFGSGDTPAPDMGQMKTIPDGEDFDPTWAEEVAMHHQMAIEMSERALREAARPETRAKAQEIIDKQKAEQAQLRSWASAWRADRD